MRTIKLYAVALLIAMTGVASLNFTAIAVAEDDAGELRIRSDWFMPVTLGPSGCPVAMVGNEVLDIKKGEIVRTLDEAFTHVGTTALSPDGKWYAASDRSSAKIPVVAVWNVTTGAKVLTVKRDEGEMADVIGFSGDTLMIAGRKDMVMKTWALVTGKPGKPVTLPIRPIKKTDIEFSPDGKMFACRQSSTITLHHTATGAQFAVVASPSAGVTTQPKVQPKTQPRDPRNPRVPSRPDADARRAELNDRTAFLSVQTMRFSPDSEELAAFTSHPSPRVLCWNRRGQLVADVPVPSARTGLYVMLEFIPDRSGWLANGILIDRQSQRALMTMSTKLGDKGSVQFIDKNRVIGRWGKTDTAVRTAKIPWNELNIALDHLKKKSPAYLTPGEPVSVVVEIKNARGKVKETVELLQGALTARLARDGIEVAEKQKTVLKLALAEKAGDKLPIYESTSRFSTFLDPGRDTGKTATEAKGLFILELTGDDGKELLWRSPALEAISGRSFDTDINDDVVRSDMLERITRQLNTILMPYYIPRQEGVIALPSVLD